MRVAVRALLIAVATAGAAAEVWAVQRGWSWVSAALDLLAGWSLVAAAGWAVHAMSSEWPAYLGDRVAAVGGQLQRTADHGCQRLIAVLPCE